MTVILYAPFSFYKDKKKIDFDLEITVWAGCFSYCGSKVGSFVDLSFYFWPCPFPFRESTGSILPAKVGKSNSQWVEWKPEIYIKHYFGGRAV